MKGKKGREERGERKGGEVVFWRFGALAFCDTL